MLPLKDSIRSRTLPIVTYIFLGLNILVFLYQMTLGARINEFVSMYGAVPYNIFHPQGFYSYASIFTSMFIHAGFMHIFGNMLFLWIFADNIEDRIGHIKFVFFYLICGTAAVLLHGVTDINSTVPMVGASGAISGVLGAYIILYPKARVLALIPFGFFMRITYLPSVIFLGIWFLYQFLFGVSTIGAKGGGVAYFAHIGGFIAGLLLALPFRKKGKNYEYKVI